MRTFFSLRSYPANNRFAKLWSCGLPFADARDNKVYNSVQTGTQCWMEKNLDTGVRMNGSGDQANNLVVEKYCYSDLESNCSIHGGLYQWAEVVQYLKVAGLAHWALTDTGGTNAVGFTALQGGTRQSTSGLFGQINNLGDLWSATEGSPTKALDRLMGYNTAAVL